MISKDAVLHYHFSWNTKCFYKVLVGDIGLRLKELIKETCATYGMTIIRGNIRPNSVNIFIRAPNDLSPAKIMQYIKGRAAHSLFKEFPELKKRYWGCHLWERGYYCRPVEPVCDEVV